MKQLSTVTALFLSVFVVLVPRKVIIFYVVSAFQLCLYVSSFIWLIRSLQEILRNLEAVFVGGPLHSIFTKFSAYRDLGPVV